MAKSKINSNQIVDQKKETAEKPNAVLSIDDLKKLLKEKEDLKLVLENEYFKLQGQIQFLFQQIQALEKR